MYRAYYPADNPTDYWKISICLVFLGHLVEGISKRIVSNEEHLGRGFYNNPTSLVNLTPEIVDRLLFNAYQRFTKERRFCG